MNTPPNMNAQTSTSAPPRPDGTGLLVLGLLSLFLGPLTAIPRLVFSKRFRPFTATAYIGYFLCWFTLLAIVLGLIAFLIFPQV
jgi:hypothetical protein